MPLLRNLSRWRLITLIAALVAWGLPATTLAAGASDARVVVAGLTPLATNDVVVNRSLTTSFDLALTQTHQRALRTFIASLSNTASPNFHHYLTPSQYARSYGATAASVAAVRHFLDGYGLRVVALSKGHDILSVSGTSANIARAFDARVETIRLSDGSLHVHFTQVASLPRALANDVTAVAGLSTVRPETTNTSTPLSVAAPTTCTSAGSSTGTTPNSVGGYTVQQQAQLYGLGGAWAAGHTGVGQTIAVYELANFDAGDVSTFFSCYGLSTTMTQTNVDGGPTPADNSSNAPDEATLDVEQTAALAPGATLEIYQGTQNANGPTDIYSRIASDNTASIVTTSWGICESQTSGAAVAEQTIFEEMAAQGQTVVAAAGDSGSSDCEGTPQPSNAIAVDDPASQPYVTGVGGLTVSTTSPLSETVWNDNCTTQGCGAGGGGESTLWSRPSWQVGPGINTVAQTRRMVPDLSVMADPSTGFIQYYTGTDTGFCTHTCSGGWGGIGGTSIGAPIVSALVAVAASACTTTSGGRLGFVNPVLYAMAPTDFVDVTTGNNDLYGVGGYSAGVGYDMASGLGSPNGASFIAGLCPSPVSSTTSSFALSSSGARALTAGPTLTATLRDANGSPVANASLKVTATATAGYLSINNILDRTNGPGSATSTVTSDASGVATFSVGSTVAQSVVVNVSYAGQTIYTTTLTYSAASAAQRVKPGAPTITKLTPLVGGFALTLRAPVHTGSSAITSYQYSINGGRSWTSLARGRKSINVVNLSRGKMYNVVARAINAVGPSRSSALKRVVTRL
ncbi:MAG TPA: protease pro-enzyme activation domain-containing protein [Acidimicrobiales bacterium]|nr:protease pro-enzyme activation domain-containing protein [Acidimicrobiales bacterium]